MATKTPMKPRLFFPNFTVALLRPKPGTDPYRVQFKISREMSKLDLVMYLKELYGVDVYYLRTIIPKDLTYGESKSYNKLEYRLALATVKEPFKFPHVDHFFTDDIKKQLKLSHVQQPEEVTHSNGPVIAKRERHDQRAPLKLVYDYPTYKIIDPKDAKKSSDWVDNWFTLCS